MKHTKIIYVIWLLMLTGCLPDISGDSPPGDQLIYPVGLATTNNDEYLIVANSNFDLRYNAGTLVAIDLEELENIPKKKAWISSDKSKMYVPESELIHKKSTIRMDAFASDLELTPNGRRALIPVRGGPERHILIVDVDEAKKNGRVLSCGEDDDLKCNGAHKVTSNDRVSLPIEPYEVASLEYQGNDSTVTSTIGFATHLYSGSVSAFIIENNEGKLDAELLDVVNNVVPEASGIAVNPLTNEVYVSGRQNDEKYIAVLKVLTGGLGGSYTNNPYVGKTDEIQYINDMYGGSDARGIAVNPSQNEALVVTRSPEALMRIDTQTRKMIDMASLGTDPSVVQLFEDEGKTYAFVLCFKGNSLYIVEPETMQVYVRPTGSGPQAITFDKKRKRAYIANFRESTISIIEATPPFSHVRVEFEGKDMELMIGKPRLPEDHN